MWSHDSSNTFIVITDILSIKCHKKDISLTCENWNFMKLWFKELLSSFCSQRSLLRALQLGKWVFTLILWGSLSEWLLGFLLNTNLMQSINLSLLLSISALFLLIDLSPSCWVILSCFFECLNSFTTHYDIVNFTLLGAAFCYIHLCNNVGLCSWNQLDPLRTCCWGVFGWARAAFSLGLV